jgi:hypothetical protein
VVLMTLCAVHRLEALDFLPALELSLGPKHQTCAFVVQSGATARSVIEALSRAPDSIRNMHRFILCARGTTAERAVDLAELPQGVESWETWSRRSAAKGNHRP